jgi:hypothetical protein
MTMTLLQARDRVRALIDDTDANPLSSDDDLDDALTTAQVEVMQFVLSSGSNLLGVEVAKTSSADGVVDLSDVTPMKVNHVHHVLATARMQVLPARSSDFSSTVAAAQTLKIGYVARPAFPAADDDAFVWASTLDAPLLDKLLCLLAASEAWIRSGSKPLEALEVRKAEVRNAILGSLNIPQWTVMPLVAATRYPTQRYASFQWVMTAPDTMQLVYS